MSEFEQHNHPLNVPGGEDCDACLVSTRCPECDGILQSNGFEATDMSELTWRHQFGPATCRLAALERAEGPIPHVVVKRLIDVKHQKEAQEEAPAVESHPAVSPEQFGEVIHVDFKNRKKLN